MYCPCNTFINTFRKDISPKCSFCNLENETRKHLFSNCKDSEDFWKKVSMFVSDIFYKIIKIDETMILFLNCNTVSEVVNNTLKVIILQKIT